MNSVGELIALFDTDYVLLSKQDRTTLSGAILLYLFRGIDSSSMSDLFKSKLAWTGQQCIDFRKRIYASGYIQKNFKMYFYARACSFKASPESFGILPKDVVFVRKLLKSKNVYIRKLIATCKKYLSQGYQPRSLDVFDLGLNKAAMEVNVFCKKFINKKFKFLTNSGQKDKESLHSEMLEYALRASYRAFPCIDNLLHLVNIMKQGIKNRGINIIKEETTQKRSRMTKNKDGTFQGTLLSLQFGEFDQTFGLERVGTGGMSVCNSLMCGLDGSSAEYERPSDVDRRKDLREVVDCILSRLKGDVPSRFVSLLMGEHDDKFSDWLGQPNEEALSKLDRKVYVEKVRQYLDVPVDTAKNFIGKLRFELQDFRN
jgi:hypothetical protein